MLVFIFSVHLVVVLFQGLFLQLDIANGATPLVVEESVLGCVGLHRLVAQVFEGPVVVEYDERGKNFITGQTLDTGQSGVVTNSIILCY